MDRWQQDFASRVSALKEHCAKEFETFAAGTLAPAFTEFEAFATRCELLASAPKGQTGVRTFRFALSEDAYVLLYFRPKGIDRIEFDYEFSVPGRGRVEGLKSTSCVERATAEWVQSCFRMGLDELVNKYAETAGCRRTEELVPV